MDKIDVLPTLKIRANNCNSIYLCHKLTVNVFKIDDSSRFLKRRGFEIDPIQANTQSKVFFNVYHKGKEKIGETKFIYKTLFPFQ